MDEPLDLADLLLAGVTAMDTAVSVADATVPDHPIVYVNPAFERLTGYAAAEVLGRNPRFMQGPDTDPEAVRAVGDGLRAGRSTRARLVNYRSDGSAFWVDLHISPVRDHRGDVVRFIAVQHDVTREVLAELEAVDAATRDALTGLVNRGAFTAELDRELARAQRTGSALAVLFLDVDAFKSVNDAHGHLVGDACLIHVATTLRERLRRVDVVARVGGDEFTVLLADLPGDGAAAADRVVDDLAVALARPFDVDGVERRISVTIGTALHPRDGSTVRALVARADAQMYERKAASPGRGAPVRD